ncbi:rhodanese-like domain-containing protein [Pasteuria penetrans]|uniref:oxygen-dependent tRNA uridine(34) hydroxylase TrhO n=1 Tax=Pasteuria penetrans TaxID=86005 RepID=UPI003CCC8A8C
MKRQPGMGSIHVKSDHCAGHVFPKLKVRVRKEIVCWRLDRDLNPSEKTGNYVTAQQFKKAMQERDTIILDGRNGYEYDLGHFRGAIRADIRTTREFPGWLRKHFRFPPHQRVVTYCTGGIRCEKLTAWLREEGYTNVAQLQGGIITYSQDEDTQGENFMGLCYTLMNERLSPSTGRNPMSLWGVVGIAKHLLRRTLIAPMTFVIFSISSVPPVGRKNRDFVPQRARKNRELPSLVHHENPRYKRRVFPTIDKRIASFPRVCKPTLGPCRTRTDLPKRSMVMCTIFPCFFLSWHVNSSYWRRLLKMFSTNFFRKWGGIPTNPRRSCNQTKCPIDQPSYRRCAKNVPACKRAKWQTTETVLVALSVLLSGAYKETTQQSYGGL